MSQKFTKTRCKTNQSSHIHVLAHSRLNFILQEKKSAYLCKIYEYTMICSPQYKINQIKFGVKFVTNLKSMIPTWRETSNNGNSLPLSRRGISNIIIPKKITVFSFNLTLFNFYAVMLIFKLHLCKIWILKKIPNRSKSP